MSTTYEDNLDSFTIKFRREIVFYLRQLINDGDRITVSFDGGQESILTVLLDVDEEAGQLIFDWGGSESVSRKLLAATRATFIATPHGVRNQFTTTRFTETTYRNRPAFATPIPETYLRLQRREFFRLSLPMTRRPPCRFTVGTPPEEVTMMGVDIGIGGIAMEGPKAKHEFTIGEKIMKAALELAKGTVITTDLEVRYSGMVTRGTMELARLGCNFLKLSPAQENELQRYITQVQREERAKLG
jgi:c-di-GMP-binding flagellar brake protein YcgR